MKILHTNFHKGWGGQSNRILIVCRELQRKGHDVILATPSGSELAKRAHAEGIGTFEKARFLRGFSPRGLWGDLRSLGSLLKEGKFDIIHTHGSQDSWALALALIGLRDRPFLLRTKHNIFPIKDHFANRWLYGRAAQKIVCISRAIMEYCAGKSYLHPENLVLIHSAVNADLYGNGNREEVRKELGWEGKYVLGIIGRLRPEKGHRILFQAIHNIKDRIPELALLVSGTGTLYQNLQDYARELHISERVRFLGFREDIPNILASLDLFVMPSYSEGLGTAALEAAAARLPIIASNVGGIPDIIEDGKTGLLVPAGDPRALAQAIQFCHNNREKAGTFGTRARERILKDFSEKALGEKNERLYQSLVTKRNVPSPFSKA
jgi:glycosyltransferase involved in cell wall biosynthesis